MSLEPSRLFISLGWLSWRDWNTRICANFGLLFALFHRALLLGDECLFVIMNLHLELEILKVSINK